MGMASSGKGPATEINVTPLVDVVLVLLIIFMVITPMLQQGQAVDIPVAPHAENKKDADDDLVITVTPAKQIWMGEELLTEETLEEKLRRELAYEPFKTILIKGDKALTYGDVFPVMKRCNMAGAKTVALMTDKNVVGEPNFSERQAAGGGS